MFMTQTEIHNLAVAVAMALDRRNGFEVIKRIETAIADHIKEDQAGKVFRIEHLDADHVRLTPVQW